MSEGEDIGVDRFTLEVPPGLRAALSTEASGPIESMGPAGAPPTPVQVHAMASVYGQAYAASLVNGEDQRVARLFAGSAAVDFLRVLRMIERRDGPE